LVVIDNVDKIIIEHLSRDSSVSTAHIHKDLTEKGILLSSRSVLNRIKRLEEHKVILGYTVRLNPALFAEKKSFIIMLKFVDFRDNPEIRKLSSHLRESSFCFFATEMVGEAEGYDYACQLVFDSKEELDLQLSIILKTFRNLVVDYQVYESNIIKQPCIISCTHGSYGVKTLKFPHKQTPDDPSYWQRFMMQCMDDMATRFLATGGYHYYE
jgi:DNA-binding Lrp family transcriptional regulator